MSSNYKLARVWSALCCAVVCSMASGCSSDSSSAPAAGAPGASATGGSIGSGSGGATSTSIGGSAATALGGASTGGSSATSSGGATNSVGSPDGGSNASTGGASSSTAGKGGGGTSVGGSAAGASGAVGASGSGGGFPISTGKPTVYLAGDSTVSTYTAAQAPQQGWGQRLQEFFTTDVTIVNRAIGGESSKSFVDEGHLTTIIAALKPGDFLFAQWGINDRYTSDPVRYTNPATTFRTYMQMYIDGAHSKNAIPVIITPTPRLDFANGMFNNDYVAYCAADQAVSTQTMTPLLDLQTKGLAYYTSVGLATVQSTICLQDPGGGANVLHFQAMGAYEMARLVAQGIKELNLPISQFVIQAKLDGG